MSYLGKGILAAAAMILASIVLLYIIKRLNKKGWD